MMRSCSSRSRCSRTPRGSANYPAEFDVVIDNDNDGDDDFIVFNIENGGAGATARPH